MVKLIHHGVNFLVLPELIGYRHHHGRLDPDTLQDYMEQVSSQLKWLHRGGYFHLDIKMSNVL
jgi:serine/threonine protein kinase